MASKHRTTGNRRESGNDYRGGVPLVRWTGPMRPGRVVVAVPGDCVRLRRHGGGQLAVAYLNGQLGDWRDLGFLKRRSARDLGLGRILIAEVRE